MQFYPPKQCVKQALTAGLLAAMVLPFVPCASLADSFVLSEGTPVRLKLTQTLTSSKNKEGDPIHLKVIDDILDTEGETVLIQAGSDAWGTISEAIKKGRMGGKGELALTIDGAKAINQATVPLRATISREGHTKLGTVVALSVLVTPLFLLMRGKDAKILAGTPLSAYIDRDTRIALPPP
jgi:hypothetical protein